MTSPRPNLRLIGNDVIQRQRERREYLEEQVKFHDEEADKSLVMLLVAFGIIATVCLLVGWLTWPESP